MGDDEDTNQAGKNISDAIGNGESTTNAVDANRFSTR